MIDLSSILLRLGVDVNFNPFSLSLFNVSFVVVVARFSHFVAFRGSIFFYNLCNFFVFLLILLNIFLCSLSPASIAKKDFIPFLFCVSWSIIVSVLNAH